MKITNYVTGCNDHRSMKTLPCVDHIGVLDKEWDEIDYRRANGPEVTASRNPLYMPIKRKPTPSLDEKRQKTNNRKQVLLDYGATL